jgi:photosystem II stability/assembly factor-like uncharacterized protein
MSKDKLEVYVGTRKGGFILRSDQRRKKWSLQGPLFSGWEVNSLSRNPYTGNIWTAVNSAWWGRDLQVSTNRGKTWKKSSAGLEFQPDRNLNLARIWRVTPANESRPSTLYCGVDPGALFRSDDDGKNWYEVRTLTDHPTRAKWNPGAGGMMVHTILPDPRLPERLYVGISAAGCFRTQDDGQSWAAANRGVRTDFQPIKFPEVGQCVHSMVMSPHRPQTLYQQNHCGVYRTDNGGEKWIDISRGLPSRFGFAIAVHPHEKETIYVVPSIGAEQRYVCDQRLGIWRSQNGGRSWKLLTKGLPQKQTFTQVLRHGAATDACDDAGVYVGTSNGELWFSRNGGDAWEVLQGQLPAIISVQTALC